MPKIHLDTDLGGDIDDLCALALLLRWPGGVEITGITTVAENGGRRAGYAHYILALEGRDNIPVAAGADNAGGYFREYLGLPPEERYWPEPVKPAPGDPAEAVRLLKHSLDQGAVIVGIGPYTNLALLEQAYPGSLARASLYLMGGCLEPPRPGYPDWDNRMDFNIQADVASARRVLEASRPTLVPLAVTVETALRRADLPALQQAGALGRLIARQAQTFAEDERFDEKLASRFPRLPADLINFQHDPLACAVALGWRDGVEVEATGLAFEEQDGWLVERRDLAGKPAKVVRRVDGPRFDSFWLNIVSQV